MDFIHPVGAWLTVGELRAALADLDDRTPVKLDVNGTQVGIAEIATSRFLVEVVAAAFAADSAALDLLAEIVEGAYTVKQAKVQAVGVLRAAGIEVEA